MRILFLSQFFDPEPFFKALPFAKELAARGHQVEVLTGFPNYPGGKIYPGYKLRFFARETMDGVMVTRVALYPSHDKSAFKRILNYVSFAISAAVLGPFLVGKADVAYVYHPPPTVGLPALIFRLFRRIPFVYDVQDLWPDSLRATGMIRNRTALGVVSTWCNVVYRFASAIVVLSPGFKERLIARGVPAGKIHLVYNWAPDESTASDVEPPVRADGAFAGKFNILFAGNIGPAQALECVLTTAEMMKAIDPEVHFVFLGSGISVDHLKQSAADRNLTNVVFLPRVSPLEAATFLQQASALLLHLKKDPLFTVTIPSKTQAYLAAGKPILIGVAGDAARLVHDAGAGLAFMPEDAPSLVSAIQNLRQLSPVELKAMGENGRAFYNSNLSRNAAVTAFEEIFKSVGRSNSGRRG